MGHASARDNDAKLREIDWYGQKQDVYLTKLLI